MLDQIVEAYKRAGYERSDIELWGVGFPGTEMYATWFADGSTASCFADSNVIDQSAYYAFEAQVDEVFIIDRDKRIRHRFSVVQMPLGTEDNSARVDEWTRELLQE